jgi:uncharacterized membrane protein YidH (DUF202 family)
VLLALTAAALVVIAVEFALAGFGAFTMDRTPTDNAYAAHVLLGLVIAVLTVLILAAVLANRAARRMPGRCRWRRPCRCLQLPSWRWVKPERTSPPSGPCTRSTGWPSWP